MLPDVPIFHPSDNFQMMQRKIQAYINDVEALLKKGVRLYSTDKKTWSEKPAFEGSFFIGTMVDIEQMELSDQEIVALVRGNMTDERIVSLLKEKK